MTETNSTLENKEVYAGIFGCIMVLGLPLNAVALWILLRHHSLKSPTAVLMVNLAISDLLLVISLPMRIYAYATGGWTLGKTACTMATMFFRSNICSSSIFITIISIDRLLAVVYPLRSRHVRTSTNTWKAAALVWTFTLVLNIPDRVAFSKYLIANNVSSCFEVQPYMTTRTPVYLQFVFMIIMLIINIICTTLVSWTLHRHLSDSAMIKNKMKVMLIFTMNLLMIMVCFLPASIGHVATMRKDVLMPLVCLASVNCCLDPLLNCFTFDAFWKKNADANET